MTIEVVKFSIRGVPDNWLDAFSSEYNSRVYAARRRYKEWLIDIILFGRIARIEAGWPPANKDNPKRTVQIHQVRHGELDEDGLQSSCKPIYDGLKCWLYRPSPRSNSKGAREMEKYEGASLIWDDRPAYCHMLMPTQEKLSRKVDPITTITVSKDE